jgi:DNA-binding MarR family transcriptional regulator
VGYALLSIERVGTPSTKLGPRMGMEPTSLSRTLKGMEEKGLIERRPDKVDGRSVRVFLTPLGLDSRRQARDLVIGINERLSTMLGSETIQQLNDGLQKLNTILEDPEHLIPLQLK